MPCIVNRFLEILLMEKQVYTLQLYREQKLISQEMGQWLVKIKGNIVKNSFNKHDFISIS